MEVVFTLYGDVCTIPEITKKIKAAGRIAMVHLDLIAGLTQKEISIDYIRDKTCADGIITTRANLIRHAKERGLATVLRYLVLDSMALDNIQKLSQQGYASQPDVIEILPGTLVPKVVKRICAMSRVPVVAGGLIQDREDVMNIAALLDQGLNIDLAGQESACASLDLCHEENQEVRTAGDRSIQSLHQHGIPEGIR